MSRTPNQHPHRYSDCTWERVSNVDRVPVALVKRLQRADSNTYSTQVPNRPRPNEFKKIESPSLWPGTSLQLVAQDPTSVGGCEFDPISWRV